MRKDELKTLLEAHGMQVDEFGMRKDQLKTILEAHGIPLDEWGKGAAKTLDHLLAEINSGEAKVEEKDGALLHVAEGAVISVYYDDGTDVWFLKEERQVFKDGRSRTRDIGDVSVGEKLKPGEDPKTAAYRGLSEELGIGVNLDLHLIPRPGVVKGPVPSISFPGLQSVYTMHVFSVFLTGYEYRAGGYIERQEDKTSYFVWGKVPNPHAPA